MPDVLLVGAIENDGACRSALDDSVGCSLLVFVEHKDQAEVGGGRPLEVEPVEHRFAEGFLVGPDRSGRAELFEPRQRDKGETLVLSARHLKILNVAVNPLGRVLLQHAAIYPIAQVAGGPRVLVVGGSLVRLCDPHDVVRAFSIELPMLLRADHVVGRGNAIARVADNRRVKSERSKRLNFHTCIPSLRVHTAIGSLC